MVENMAISWNIDNDQFWNTKAFDILTVSGTVPRASLPISVKVMVLPANLLYAVDCAPASPSKLQTLLDGRVAYLNEGTPDQAYDGT